MEEREGRDGGVKGTSLAGMHISPCRHAYAWGWSKTPIKMRGGVDQMERKEGGIGHVLFRPHFVYRPLRF